jgi:hypothetical protein
MDLDLLGAQSAAMAASGESCRRRGHAVVSLTDPGCVKRRRIGGRLACAMIRAKIYQIDAAEF